MTEPLAKKPNLIFRLIRWVWRLMWMLLLLVVGINCWVPLSQQQFIYTDTSEIPDHDWGIVLGTTKSVGAFRNRHFTYRMEAAAALYKAGKVRYLLLSGDGAKAHYNEPRDMQEALEDLGVPKEACKLDPNGLRSDMTFSRAREEFGISEATIVSDDFHLPRCLMLAKHYGISGDAFYIKSVPWSTSSTSRVREWLARVRMFGDFFQER